MPINRKIGVNLAFTADTKQAQAQLNNLQNTLTQLVKTAPTQGFSGFTEELQLATTAASVLKAQLAEATNVNTGKLDLGKFNQSMKTAGMSLDIYKQQLANLGPQGVAAFGQLSQAIMNAEMPLRRSSQLLTDFATTLKNTARWQISSSILHGFMGSVQSAYYYAQDLNESLNNIRIVTGKNVDEMADFAKEANSAAQALSTTTTAYTDASLIYYQQGLPDEQVKERTDVTIKMANVARESATEVSEQMTAIWNNFAKGGENLEYYSDVITALGAATASSSAEIAEGLEKFAAVADTVGLSYEYATSALATVTATTRQSADIVGNAFKTLFSRIQGLKLGETLDDGTDLNKYSAALEAVGVNIKGVDGELKDMDVILDELGNKWQTLGKDQKMALAQTVAGVRQYTQLIALMDNWDFFQENLSTARNSKGTLQEQADIYAESWEAAQKRVKAAAEQIYDDLLNDKFFINLNDSFAKILNTINDFIKGIGGIKSILAIAGTALLKLFGTQLAQSIDNTIYSLKNLTKAGRESLEETKTTANNLLQDFYSSSKNPFDQNIGKAYASLGEVQNDFIKKAEKMGDTQKLIATYLMDQHKVLVDNVVQQQLITKEAEKQARQALTQANLHTAAVTTKTQQSNVKKEFNQIKAIAQREGKFAGLAENMFGGISRDTITGDNASENLKTLKTNIESVIQEYGKLNGTVTENRQLLKQSFTTDGANAFINLYEAIKNVDTEIPLTNQQVKEISNSLDVLHNIQEQSSISIESLEKKVTILTQDYGLEESVVRKVIAAFYGLGEVEAESFIRGEALKNGTDTIKEAMEGLAQKVISVGQAFAAYAQATSTAAMTATNITSGINTLTDKTAGLTQKISALSFGVASLGTVIVKASAAVAEMIKGTANATSYANVYMAALTVLITVISLVVKSIQDQIQAQIDLNNKEIERVNKLQEEVNANKELYNSYNKLYQQYEDNKIEKEELYDITDQLCDKYDLEGGYLAKLTGDYKELTKAIKEKRKTELEEIIKQTNNEKAAAEANLLPTGRGGKGYLYGNSYRVDFSAGNSHLNDEQKVFKYLKDIEGSTLNQIEDASGNKYWDSLSFNINAEDPQKIISLYDELVDRTNKIRTNLDPTVLANSKTYNEINEWIEKMTPAMDEYKASLKEVQQYQIEYAGLNLQSAASLEDFVQKAAEFKEEVSKIDGIEDAESAVNEYIASLENNYSKLYLGLRDLKNQLNQDAQKYIDEELSEGEKEYLLSGKVDLRFVTTKEDIQNEIQASFNNYGTFEVKAPVDLATELVSGKKLNKASKKELAALEEENPEAMAGFDDKSVLHQLDVIDEITQYRINKNQEYLNNFKDITEETLDIRKNEREQLENDARYQNLKEAEQHRDLTEEEIQDLEEYRQKIEEVKGEILSLNDALAKGLSFEEIEDIGFNDLISGIDLVVDRSQLLQNAAELIGEGFKVAASDVEKFSNTFPELLEASTILENGDLQLNEQIVQTKIAGIQEETKARNEAKLAEIDQQIQLKELEQTYLKDKLNALQEYLQGKRTEQETIDAINKAGAEYEGQLMKITGEEISNLEAHTLAASNSEGSALISMLDQVGKGFAQAAAAHYAMLNGQPFEWSELNFSGAASSAHDYASSFGEQAQTLYEKNSAMYEQIYDEALQVQDQLNTVNGEIDKLKAQKAVIQSTGNAAAHALDNISKGKAGKDSNSKSGGSSKKDKERDKEQKKLEEEFDRYWELKKAIDAVDKAISKLEKDQQNLYGYELINSLKEENKLLEQQKGHYEALAEAQRQEAAELQGVLAGYGIAFDASGAITNYAAATSAALAQYNDAIAQYNAGLIEESALKVYEKNYEAFKKALERYDTLFYNEMKDTQDKLDDLWRKELANNLKAWEVEVKLKLDMKELKRGWNDFLKEIKEDFKKVYKDVNVDLKNLKKNAKTYVSGDGTINTIIKAIHDVTGEIDKLRSGGASDMFESISQAQEKLKELNEQLQDAARGLNDLRKEAYELYLSQIEQIGDMFDAIRDDFEAAKDEIEFVQQAYELILGEKAYDKKDEIYKAQEAANSNEVQALRKEYEFYKGQLDELGTLEKDRTEWTKDELEFYNKMMDAQTNLNDAILEGMELFKKDYLNTVEKIRDTLDKDMTGGKGLEYAKESWERAREAADLYLDDVQKLTEAQSLTNKVEGLMSSTTDTAAQAKLQKFLDKEVQALKEKEKVSKYEVEAAQAKLDIVEKEIALRDAQENKTSMKLTRNEQGNWTYQYVADEDDVNAKQQDMLESLTKIRELALSTNTELEELIFETQETTNNAIDKLKELLDAGAITREEYDARYEEIENQHAIKMNYIQEQMAIVRDDAANASAALLWGLYEQDPENYQAMTTEEQKLIDGLRDAGVTDFLDLEEKTKENFQGIGDKSQEVMDKVRIDDWHTTAQDILNEWTKDNGDSVRAKMKEAITAIGNAHDEMIKNMKNKLTEGGKSYDSLTNDINDAVKMTDKLRDETDDYANKSEPRLDESRRLIEAIENAWSKVKGPIEDAIHTIEEYLQYVGDTKIAMDELTQSAANAANAITAVKAAEAMSGGSGGTLDNSGTPDSKKHGVYNTSPGAGNAAVYQTDNLQDAKDWAYQANGYSDEGPFKWYDTGGYTGEWNSGSTDGRLAFLHQKELVLNKDDTSNFLEGINTIRDMSSLNGSISKAIVSSVANMVLALSKHDINVPAGASSESVSAGDVFNITAEFPNANDVNEIRQAILSLPNLASQYMAQNGR